MKIQIKFNGFDELYIKAFKYSVNHFSLTSKKID